MRTSLMSSIFIGNIVVAQIATIAQSVAPVDFFSAIDFVTATDYLMQVLYGTWIIALMLFNGKIFFGSLFLFIRKAFHAADYGETGSELMGRARLGWKILGSFFAGFILIGASWSYMNWILYGFSFFLVLWLAQLNSKEKEKVIVNRLFSILGFLVVGFFSWLFARLVLTYGSSLVQNLGVLYGSGLWSVLVATILLMGFAGVFAVLVLLCIRSFNLVRSEGTLTVHQEMGKEYLMSTKSRHKTEKYSINEGQPNVRCTICRHIISQGFICYKCGYAVCWDCIHRDPILLPTVTGGCPKCGVPMYPYPGVSLPSSEEEHSRKRKTKKKGGDNIQ